MYFEILKDRLTNVRFVHETSLTTVVSDRQDEVAILRIFFSLIQHCVNNTGLLSFLSHNRVDLVWLV